MMMCNLSMELEHIIDKELIQNLTQECIKEIIEQFRQSDSGLILEYVNTKDGSKMIHLKEDYLIQVMELKQCGFYLILLKNKMINN